MPTLTGALVEKLETIAAPRRQCTNLKHPLVGIVIAGFCGVLGGCEDFVEIATWAKGNEVCFRSFLELLHGIPSHNTFNRGFALLKPTTLQEVLLPWLRERRGRPGDWIHVDGKTRRRTRCQSLKLKTLHVVSAWAGQSGILLRQRAVNAKSNEITAMPELLKLWVLDVVFREDARRIYDRTAAENVAFLNRRAYPEKVGLIYVIQDNWNIHTHPDVLSALEEYPRIKPVWLPTYAPWLNPIEKLWRWLRQDILKMHRWVEDWPQVKQRVQDFLDQFAHGSSALLRYVDLKGKGKLATVLNTS